MTGYEMQTELMNKNNHDTIVAYGPIFTSVLGDGRALIMSDYTR